MRLLRWLKLSVIYLLTSCTLLSSADFVVPSVVNFKGVIYQKVTDTSLDAMQQMLYLAQDSTKDPNNWQQGVLIFLDKNKTGKTLQSRVALRQQHFRQQNTLAKIMLTDQELRTEVIYPPTERFDNVQLEITRGRDSHCGYSQIQFAEKRSISAKNWQNLTAYQQALSTLANEFAQLPWLIECH
ncbi:hypothetical protein EV693_11632 [Nicoletella semolina]|uniref:Uncharacterized protein n=1 Tax=Nicoletella semolina TaxID=271160 RepID=A0A4V2SJK2_9PAST|nr:ABC transporter ATPase [Nicoletella semolina]MDH2924079.1 ABC transporter ATPase [Nicoletella semolina]TCP15916.1 hypothetical protein EV693_11632 [Nicoletella semolina]